MSVLPGPSLPMDLLILLGFTRVHRLDTPHICVSFFTLTATYSIFNLTSYSHWRGEWGLVSYMIVMSMTIGQTNSSGLLR